MGIEASYFWRRDLQFYTSYDYYNLDEQQADSFSLGLRFLFGQRSYRRELVASVEEPVKEVQSIGEPEAKQEMIVETAPDDISIQFTIDRYNLNETDIASIQRIADMLKAEPDMVLDMIGRASAIGDSQRSLEVSSMRVHAVAHQLYQFGIEPHRVRSVFIGDKGQRPIIEEQRVDLMFLKESNTSILISQNIEFGIFSTRLSKQDVMTLDQFARSSAQGESVSIVSYETVPGHEIGLRLLASERANLIKRKLLDLGVSIPIHTSFLVSEGSETHKRRVELKLLTKSK